MRMFFMLPFLILLCGRGAEWLFAIYDTRRGLIRHFLAACLVVGMGVSLLYNIDIYYIQFPNRANEWEGLGHHMILQAKIIKANAGTAYHIVEADSSSPILEYFSGLERSRMTVVSNEIDVPFYQKCDHDIMIYTKHWKMVKTQELVHKYYPNATFTDYKNKWDQIYLRLIRIPLADIQKVQAGHALLPPLPL